MWQFFGVALISLIRSWIFLANLTSAISMRQSMLKTASGKYIFKFPIITFKDFQAGFNDNTFRVYLVWNWFFYCIPKRMFSLCFSDFKIAFLSNVWFLALLLALHVMVEERLGGTNKTAVWQPVSCSSEPCSQLQKTVASMSASEGSWLAS